jgi:hypothetical protein
MTIMGTVEIKEYELSTTFVRMGRVRNSYTIWSEILNGRISFVKIYVYGRIILMRVLRKSVKIG